MKKQLLENPESIFSHVGFSLAISFLVVNIVQLSIVAILTVRQSSLLSSRWLTWCLIAISFYCIGFPLFCFMVRKLPKDTAERETQKLTITQIIKYACMSYTLAYIFNLFTLIITTAITLLKQSDVTNVGQQLVTSTSSIGFLLCGVILSPIVEELLFRKVLLDKVRMYGDKIAILISAVAFGIYHGNLSQLFYATALGAIFAYITLKTNRIHYAIILHIFINGMSGFLLPLLLGDGMSIIRTTIMLIIIGIILVAGTIALIKELKQMKFKQGTYYIHREKILKTVFGNGGMIGYLVFGVVMILLTL